MSRGSIFDNRRGARRVKSFRKLQLGACVTFAIVISSSLHADQPQAVVPPEAGLNGSENVALSEAEAPQPLRDCGDQKTIIVRKTEQDEPLRLDSTNITDEEWAAYERKVRERFNMEPLPENAEETDKPKLEYVEGCALDQWEVDQKNRNFDPGSEAEVFYTGIEANRSKLADTSKDSDQTGSGGARKTADSRPSAKSSEDRVSIKNLLDMLLVQIILAVGLVTTLFFGLRYLVRYILGYFLRRRTCRISAELFTKKYSFSGHILILGKKGCRFTPEDYALMEEVLDIPEFLSFSISAGGVTKPVWVNKTYGTAVVAFFDDNLSRAEQEAMLKNSTIEVKFDKWQRAKVSRKKGMKSVKERIARLHELREE